MLGKPRSRPPRIRRDLTRHDIFWRQFELTLKLSIIDYRMKIRVGENHAHIIPRLVNQGESPSSAVIAPEGGQVLFREQNRFVTVHKDPVFEMVTQSAGKHGVLHILAQTNHILDRIAVSNPGHILFDDRPRIEL